MRHCMVVDDSSVIRKVARRILEDLKFETSEAEDGAQALARCRARMPDIILLDCSMPVMDGFEFLAALRKEQGGGTVKVIFCTTENDATEIARAMRAGADEYVMKPFDRDILQAKFEEAGLI